MSQVVSPFITTTEDVDDPRPAVDSPTEIPVMTEQHLHVVAILQLATSSVKAHRVTRGQLHDMTKAKDKLEVKCKNLVQSVTTTRRLFGIATSGSRSLKSS